MKIAYSHQIFTEQNYGGISRYFVELATALAEMGESPLIFAGLHRNEYLRGLEPGKVKGWFCPVKNNRGSRLRHALSDIYMKATLPGWQPEIIHDTFYRQVSYPSVSVPRVVTVYDMIYELFPEHEAHGDASSREKRDAVAQADHVICISHSTRNDLIRLFGTPPEKVSVVHLGCQQSDALAAPAPRAAGKPYLLFVGSRAGIKNFKRLLEAFAGTHLQATYDLVMFGGGAFGEAERQQIQAAGLSEDCVRWVQGNDRVLAGLYAGARAFVYPSLYEGFGLPPLEAMAQGCPVASSNTSSMPEVIGPAAEYFDPTDIEAMTRALQTVLTDEVRRAELIDEGSKRVEHFTWEKTARETRAIYRKLLDSTEPLKRVRSLT